MNMRMMFPLYAEADDAGSGGLTVDEIGKALAEDDGDDDEPIELEKPDKAAEVEEEGKEEEKEDEIKLADEGEELPVELIVPVSKKKILAKYPNLFKEFPYLETAYYADQAYKEILPTIDDAKEAIEKSKVLDGFEQNLASGDTGRLLATIKQADPKAFDKIVDNYLPTLARVDKGAFDHVITNVTRQTIMAMAQEARDSNNEELGKAALLLNQFAFGTSKFTPPAKLVNETQENNNQTQRERADFVRERFSVVKEDLDTRLNNTLKSTIDQHLDPKGSMTDYVKKNATREALEMTDRIIANDQTFRRQLDSLWKRAYENNFNRDSIQRIRSAYLSKAKTILPQVISKTRNEALRGLNRTKDQPKRILGNRSDVNTKNTKSDEKGKVPKGMSTFDYLKLD